MPIGYSYNFGKIIIGHYFDVFNRVLYFFPEEINDTIAAVLWVMSFGVIGIGIEKIIQRLDQRNDFN
ncbi:hypothetical protein EHQ81_12440 [Leptospira selangorensis]|uniref:Uncharacterized protein n=1 Tax=Leptospira selangorensis TaxID=2484982 RepID=A0A5F2C6J7_9LEPT|nr:hypothetical protein [Leptospira selangorensis]TGM12695.1 hypothetical protein EHQ81_12440 [Leptospira selangorensis]TGM30756.1 hypothetical protein EHQ82_00280 [Leptospira selangorensis]